MTKRKVYGEEIRMLKDVPQGEYVRTINTRGKPSRKVYIREEYDPSVKGFWLQNAEDISEGRYAKGTTRVLVGFTY